MKVSETRLQRYLNANTNTILAFEEVMEKSVMPNLEIICQKVVMNQLKIIWMN